MVASFPRFSSLLVLIALGGFAVAPAQEIVWIDTIPVNYPLERDVLVGSEAILFISEIYTIDDGEVSHNDYSPRSWDLQCYSPEGAYLWGRRFNPLDTADWWQSVWGDTGSIQAAVDPDGTFWFWHPVFRAGERESIPSWLVRYHLSQAGDILEQDTLQTRVSRVNPNGTATRLERLPNRAGYRFIRWGRDLRVKDTIEFPELDEDVDSWPFIRRELWEERGDTILLVAVNAIKPTRSFIQMRTSGGVDLFPPYVIQHDSTPRGLPVDVDFMGKQVLLVSNLPWIALLRPGGDIIHEGLFARENRERRLLSHAEGEYLVLERSPFNLLHDTLLIFDENLALLDVVDLSRLQPWAVSYSRLHGLFFCGIESVGPAWMNNWKNSVGRIALGVNGVEEQKRTYLMDLW